MALKGLKTRIISALIFLVIILGGIFGGSETFGIMVALMTILLLWEFLNIVVPADNPSKKTYIILWTIVALIPVVYFFLKQYQGDDFELSTFAPLAIALIFLPLLFELISPSSSPFGNVGGLFLGYFYITIPMILFIDIAFSPSYSPYLVLGLFLMTWINDIGAYFVGSLMGKTPLAPTISPKKTLEGSIGGWIFTIAAAVLYFHLFMGKNWGYAISLGIIAGFFGTVGDLIESKLKRSAGIKDSGQLMPGHGGLLDRFDAFIFFLPFVYLFIEYAGAIFPG